MIHYNDSLINNFEIENIIFNFNDIMIPNYFYTFIARNKIMFKEYHY